MSFLTMSLEDSDLRPFLEIFMKIVIKAVNKEPVIVGENR